MKNLEKPLVAIHCLAYNHELFIRDCLEGFVMQKTTFPFVAIVHDDASTDGTAEIIKEYEMKYPDIIKPIYETTNLYLKSYNTLANIMLEALKQTGAKYVAFCEGDDFWIDSHKLQCQVDFLESHPDYTMCFHNAILRYQDTDDADRIMSNLYTGDYTTYNLLEKWPLPLASIMIRHDVIASDEYRKITQNNPGGINYFTVSSLLGKTYCNSKCFSVYRKNKGGASYKMSFDYIINAELNIYYYFKDKHIQSIINKRTALSISSKLPYLVIGGKDSTKGGRSNRFFYGASRESVIKAIQTANRYNKAIVPRAILLFPYVACDACIRVIKRIFAKKNN